MIVLGIDPGTAALGYGIVEATAGRLREVDHGCLTTSADERLPDRLLAIHALVDELLALHQPDVLAVVRSHHERWDGGGYPDGKRGEEIPLAARIVAVADAFQAMIEPRPYREPRTQASALAEITSESGHQFDPSCVEALRAVLS